MKLVGIRSVVNIFNHTWSSVFTDFKEVQIIVIELEQERRGEYEPSYIWDGIIERMNDINKMNVSDSIKISKLMNSVCQILLLPPHQFPKTWLLRKSVEIKDKINYYKNNPEEE